MGLTVRIKDEDQLVLQRVGDKFLLTFAGNVRIECSVAKWAQLANLILAPADKASLRRVGYDDGTTPHQTIDDYAAIRERMPQGVKELVPATPVKRWKIGDPLTLG